jgi:hypothetical protein
MHSSQVFEPCISVMNAVVADFCTTGDAGTSASCGMPAAPLPTPTPSRASGSCGGMPSSPGRHNAPSPRAPGGLNCLSSPWTRFLDAGSEPPPAPAAAVRVPPAPPRSGAGALVAPAWPRPAVVGPVSPGRGPTQNLPEDTMSQAHSARDNSKSNCTTAD